MSVKQYITLILLPALVGWLIVVFLVGRPIERDIGSKIRIRCQPNNEVFLNREVAETSFNNGLWTIKLRDGQIVTSSTCSEYR